MFRKLKSGLAGKGAKAKFRLDVAVERVEGLPPAVGAARLQWARGAKVAVTKLVPASGGGWRVQGQALGGSAPALPLVRPASRKHSLTHPPPPLSPTCTHLHPRQAR